MSYDYSSETKQLELPNPYRVQNTLMWVSAAILVLGGLICLWWGRQAWLLSHAAAGAAPIAAGLGLLTAGIWAAGRAATRLRFFFGRKRPQSLADDLQPGQAGTSDNAKRMQDLLRQGALEYPEPQGPIEGILYNLVPHLITAPQPLQALARRQFFNLAALAVTLLSFGVAWLLVTRDSAKPWVALLYFVFGFVFLLRPVVSQSQAHLSIRSLVGLVAAAILGPVVLGWAAPSLPSLAGLSLLPQMTVMLLSALIALVIVMLAIVGQVAPPPATRTSAEQLRMSMNVPPSLLMDELDRRLQETWTERIPNRRYARTEPLIDPARHAAPFAGELLEETQPMPVGGSTAPTLQAALASARHKWIAVLDLYSTGLTVAAVGFALAFVHGFEPGQAYVQQHFALMGMAAILLLVALFCQHLAQELWGRFDFESSLVWVEFSGTYQTSSIGTGNALSSKLNTQNQIVRTEAMTLRVWRARIESVAFSKDGQRLITAMFSTDKEAKELASHLMDFGQSQSALIAPMALEDRERMSMLGASEQHLSQAIGPAGLIDTSVQAALGLPLVAQGAQPAAQDASNAPAATPKFCHACGAGLASGARFCSTCGKPV